MNGPPWDQPLARMLVRPLERTPVHPNHLTTIGLALGLTAGESIFPARAAGCRPRVRRQARGK